MLKINKNYAGFTLIELLTVIAIIALLSTIIISAMNNTRQDARDARRAADIKQLQMALEMYFDDNRKYPNDVQGLAILASRHIAVIPTDPISGNYVYASYLNSAIGAGNRCGDGGNCLYYHLGANLEGDSSILRSSDRDIAGDAIDGEDSDGCANEVSRWCYDVVP